MCSNNGRIHKRKRFVHAKCSPSVDVFFPRCVLFGSLFGYYWYECMRDDRSFAQCVCLCVWCSQSQPSVCCVCEIPSDGRAFCIWAIFSICLQRHTTFFYRFLLLLLLLDFRWLQMLFFRQLQFNWAKQNNYTHIVYMCSPCPHQQTLDVTIFYSLFFSLSLFRSRFSDACISQVELHAFDVFLLLFSRFPFGNNIFTKLIKTLWWNLVLSVASPSCPE